MIQAFVWVKIDSNLLCCKPLKLSQVHHVTLVSAQGPNPSCKSSLIVLYYCSWQPNYKGHPLTPTQSVLEFHCCCTIQIYSYVSLLSFCCVFNCRISGTQFGAGLPRSAHAQQSVRQCCQTGHGHAQNKGALHQTESQTSSAIPTSTKEQQCDCISSVGGLNHVMMNNKGDWWYLFSTTSF